MGTTTKKATFNLHTEVLEAMEHAMEQGMASSKNALVEQALVKELKELKRQTRKALWQKAALDPVFMRDIEKVETDFKQADADSAGSADQ
jgi:hypothetical protein